MKGKLTLLFALALSIPAFGAAHIASRAVVGTAKVAYFPAKKSAYPVRHPVKTTKSVAKGAGVVAKTIF
jgi:hypothetical protein